MRCPQPRHRAEVPAALTPPARGDSHTLVRPPPSPLRALSGSPYLRPPRRAAGMKRRSRSRYRGTAAWATSPQRLPPLGAASAGRRRASAARRERAGSSGCPGNGGAISDRGGGWRGGARRCAALRGRWTCCPESAGPAGALGPRPARYVLSWGAGWQPPLLLTHRCVVRGHRTGGGRRPAAPQTGGPGTGWWRL